MIAERDVSSWRAALQGVTMVHRARGRAMTMTCWALMLGVGTGPGLAAGPAAPAGPRPSASSPALATLQSLIGDAACRDDTHCRTLPVGQLACGGPAAFIAWSTVRSTEADLRAAAAPLARRQPGSGAGDLSVCRVVPDPGARCVMQADTGLGQCRLRSTGPGHGAPLPAR